MGKSKTKKFKTHKTEVSKDESIHAKQDAKLLSKSKKHKQGKSAKTNASPTLTIPLILLAFISLLLGILIVLVSEYLEPRQHLTQPPNFKIICNEKAPDIEIKENEDIQMQRAATQDTANEQTADNMDTTAFKNNKQKSSAPASAEDAKEHVASIRENKTLFESKNFDELENQIRDETLQQTVEENKSQKDYHRKLIKSKQDELHLPTQTDDIKQKDDHHSVDIDTKKEQEDKILDTVDYSVDYETDHEESKEEIQDNKLFKQHENIQADSSEFEGGELLMDKSVTENNKQESAYSDRFDSNQEQNSATTQSKYSVDKSTYHVDSNVIEDEELNAFGNLQDGLIGFPSNEEMNKAKPIANDENLADNAEKYVNLAEMSEIDTSRGASKHEASLRDMHEQLKNQDDNQNINEGESVSIDDDKVVKADQDDSTKSTLEPLDEVVVEHIRKDENHDVGDETSYLNDRSDVTEQQTQFKQTKTSSSVEHLDKTDQKKEIETDNKNNNLGKQDNNSNHTSASPNISNNSPPIVKKEITFFQKSEDDLRENMDVIYDQQEDEDETDDDENGTFFVTDVEEQTYHVEEKRIKIIKDSQFVPITDGVRKHILREGYGATPKKGDQVTLQCIGYIDKIPPKLFWNTKELGQRPFKFVLGEKQVIKGWDEAAASMKLLERSKFKIEAKKAYGKFGFGAWDIPPDTDLIMEFQLIDIKRSFLSKSRNRFSRNR